MTRTAHLFAGGGGGMYADLILGHEPVLAVEWSKPRCDVLRARRDEGWWPNCEIVCCDVREFDAAPWRGRVDQLAAGFPCQPFSCAGQRRGKADERNMWPATVPIIAAIRPAWVWLENVRDIVSGGYVGTVLGDLAALGYDAEWDCIAASDVGAPHKRGRWWCLAADSNSVHRNGREPRECAKAPADADGVRVGWWPDGAARYESDGQSTGRQQEAGRAQVDVQTLAAIRAAEDYTGIHNWPPPDAGVRGMVHGLARRQYPSNRERIAMLGDGQVPLQAAAAWLTLRRRYENHR